MVDRVSSLSAYASKLYDIVDDDALRRIGRAAGFAGKDAALSAAAETLGADRAMSGFKGGRVKLGAGFDPGATAHEVVIKHRPAGVWMLADKGRQSSGPIYRRKGRRKGNRPNGAVLTPMGPRASSHYGPSRGVGSLRRAAARERTVIPKAAFKALQVEIAKVVR